MPNRTAKQFNDDHDLLIRLDTKVDNLTNEIVMMRDNTTRRVEQLDHDKVDVTDFLEFKKHMELEIAKASTFGSNSLAEYRRDNDARAEDHEKRMRTIESKIAIATGIVIAAQTIVSALLKFL